MVMISKRQVTTQISPQHGIEGRFTAMLHSTLHWMACFGVLMAVVGCGSHEEHHGDHHEDEHLEHFVPAHKPADYAALVEQLEKRIGQQSQVSGSKEGAAATAQSATERQELIDIIGWIPELAADSELRKQDFETAVSAGASLSIALGFEEPGEGTVPVDQSFIPKLLEELRALVSKSQTSTEPM